jgi:hypothetical protein
MIMNSHIMQKQYQTSPTFETMVFLGGDNGSSMAEVEIAYLTTYENYRHRFQITIYLKTHIMFQVN